MAARSENMDCLAKLLNAGCNPFYCNGLGQHSLDLALRENVKQAINTAIQQWQNQVPAAQLQTFIN